MTTRLRLIFVVLALSAWATHVDAHANYIGYSGAPASNGRCAASCHGASGGTVQITGFPAEYDPDQIYTITISHSGGSAIRQFNGSCRMGTGSQNAGVIASGTNTVTYNTAVETNGVHLSSIDQDTGTFLWTAPPSGSGEVRLYVAGHQGSSGGANTSLTLVATEASAGVDHGNQFDGPAGFLLTNNFPNPFASQTTIGFYLPRAASVVLEIFDSAGRKLESSRQDKSEGYHEFLWDSSIHPAGVYYYRIQAGHYTGAKKIVLAK